MRLSLWTRKRFFFVTLKGRQLPEPLPPSFFFCFPAATREESPEKLPSQFTAPPSPFLPAIKSPHHHPVLVVNSLFSLQKKIILEKKGEGDKRRGEARCPFPPPLCSAVLPTCAHGRRGEVGPARGPAARAGAGAGGGAGGHAGEGREGAGGALLRRLPALRQRLPSRVRCVPLVQLPTSLPSVQFPCQPHFQPPTPRTN
jgi:hypothetical protein